MSTNTTTTHTTTTCTTTSTPVPSPKNLVPPLRSRGPRRPSSMSSTTTPAPWHLRSRFDAWVADTADRELTQLCGVQRSAPVESMVADCLAQHGWPDSEAMGVEAGRSYRKASWVGKFGDWEMGGTTVDCLAERIKSHLGRGHEVKVSRDPGEQATLKITVTRKVYDA